jgi:15-cis-phytoene synthase
MAVRTAARDHAFDDYLVALLAPRALRADLLALAAYFGDIARIPLTVGAPGLGEIRLQWWRDAIERGSGGGHPVADALVDAASRRAWSVAILLQPLDAHAVELYADPLPGEAAFEAYLSGIEGARLALQAQCWGVAQSDDVQSALESAGRTLSLVRLLRRFPLLVSKGRLPFPATRFPDSWPGDLSEDAGERALRTVVNTLLIEAENRLTETRLQLGRIPVAARQPFLSLALARPYLRALRRPGYNPLRQVADVSPITRVSTLWLAHMLGRI